MSYFSIFLKTFTRPATAFRQLIEKPQRNRAGFYFILWPIAGYTALYIFLTIAHGAPSTLTPWLNISKDEYYYWNRMLLAPSMLICWFTTATFIHVVCRNKNKNIDFDDTLAVLSLAISVAMTFALLHDLPMSIASATHVIDARQHEIAMNSPTTWRTLLWLFYSMYTVAFLVLFPIAASVLYNASTPKAIITGVLAFVLFQTLFLVFNR